MEQKVINCPHCGKFIPKDAFTEKIMLTQKCPQRGSVKSFRNGFRNTHCGKVQRYLCRECGYRFS
jgi:transposase-like protein